MVETYQATSVFTGQQFLDNAYITIEDGVIKTVSQTHPGGNVNSLQGLLTPGFVDVQVNGGGGVLFNNTPTSQALALLSDAHTAFGTTSMLPTLITDDVNVMTNAARAISETVVCDDLSVVGVHFEGPHLSKPKKGIHPAEHIRHISDAELTLFCRQDLGKVVVTLAPENVPCDIIRELVNRGVIVCLGHSNADAETVLQALEAGATGFTHLFNAMSPLTGRAPGMVGAALLDQHSYCGLIADKHHVHPLSCQLAIKAKGFNQIMLVTDAMAHVGSSLETLTFFDTEIIRHGTKLTLPNGNIAGSALDMASAVRHCHQDFHIPLAEALCMATKTPANFLGMANSIGQLTPGCQANMVLLDSSLNVVSAWIKGQVKHTVHFKK